MIDGADWAASAGIGLCEMTGDSTSVTTKRIYHVFTYMIDNNTFTVMYMVTAWLSGNGVAHNDKVILHQARLVLRWVTAYGFNSQCRTFTSVYDQPPRSTQPGHPFMGRHNE